MLARLHTPVCVCRSKHVSCLWACCSNQVNRPHRMHHPAIILSCIVDHHILSIQTWNTQIRIHCTLHWLQLDLQSVAVRRSTGNDVSGHYFHRYFLFWHEQSALQSVAVRRSTGNDVSGHYFHCYFLLPSSSLTSTSTIVERWDGYILNWSSHPPIRESTAMTSKMKQRTKTKELDELQDKLDEPYEIQMN